MPVDLSYRDDCAVMTLNRPEALNALSAEVLRLIGAVFDDVAQSKARALIVTGAGDKAFCAGADVKELRGRSMAQDKLAIEFGQMLFARLDTYPIASVAVINGYAFGGGLELALACTFRLATAKAKMALPEIKLGLIPGYGGTQRLPRLIGEARALDMVLTGRTVEAAEAERIGLVNRLIEGDPIEAGIAFARGFTQYSLPVLGFARSAVQRALSVPLREGLKIETDLATLAYRAQDSAEGIAAFEQKRKANFRDA
jgi:enoyl-CoA hydratase